VLRILLSGAGCFVWIVLLVGCVPLPGSPTPTFFHAPLQPPSPTPSLTPTLPPTRPIPTRTPTPVPSPTPCQDNLRYLEDVTFAGEKVAVAPGQIIDKQWRVENNGTCPWGNGYTLRLTGGSAWGAAEQQPLYPAMPGAQVVLRILFIAPQEPGDYRTEWHAFNPQGQQFGDVLYLSIQVLPITPTP